MKHHRRNCHRHHQQHSPSIKQDSPEPHTTVLNTSTVRTRSQCVRLHREGKEVDVDITVKKTRRKKTCVDMEHSTRETERLVLTGEQIRDTDGAVINMAKRESRSKEDRVSIGFSTQTKDLQIRSKEEKVDDSAIETVKRVLFGEEERIATERGGDEFAIKTRTRKRNREGCSDLEGPVINTRKKKEVEQKDATLHDSNTKSAKRLRRRRGGHLDGEDTAKFAFDSPKLEGIIRQVESGTIVETPKTKRQRKCEGLASPHFSPLVTPPHSTPRKRVKRKKCRDMEGANEAVRLIVTKTPKKKQKEESGEATSPYFPLLTKPLIEVVKQWDWEATATTLLDQSVCGRIPHTPVYKPLTSPHALIQEKLYVNPWALLTSTIFLNRTNGTQALPKLWDFLKKYPIPELCMEGMSHTYSAHHYHVTDDGNVKLL